MTKLRGLRGMPDVLPAAQYYWHYLESNIKQLMLSYGYDRIQLPILEPTALFKRSLGDDTDIIEKEMFAFQREDTSMALRPEGTAGCVRACIEHSLTRNQQVQRLWYYGPMFRAERPQRGRYRQFYHFGVESFSQVEPVVEAEHLAMIYRLWKLLGLDGIITLEINSLGDSSARSCHRAALVEYFNQHHSALDEDSQRRLVSNPLRILDSKNPDLQDIINNAPKINSYLEPDCQEHFAALQAELAVLNIPFTINHRLVRGLDYYNRTVYEWVTDKLGAQSAVCAGGRYDGLMRQLGGTDTPAVGFALGLERVILLLQELALPIGDHSLDGYLITVGDAARVKGLSIAELIRDNCKDFKLLASPTSASLGSQLKKANKSGAKLALIVGDEEIQNSYLTVKHLRSDQAQTKIFFSDIADNLGALV